MLYVDPFTGATDLVMDPRDPKVLYAATYQRLRKAFGFNGGGPGSAIYKSTDAGATWKKLENGIPAGDKGRIGLALALSKPDVLVATIEHATAGGTYRTEDAGATWKRMSATNPRPMYYSKPTIDPNNDKRIWLPGTYIVKSEDGGATFAEEPTSPTYDVGLKTDHHVIRVDPANSSHIYVVGDGGLHESFDMGKTFVRVNNIPVAQVYRIAVDNRDPYWVCGPPGQPLVDGAERHAPLARHPESGLGRDRLQRRHRQGGGQDRLAQGLLLVQQRQPVARRPDDR